MIKVSCTLFRHYHGSSTTNPMYCHVPQMNMDPNHAASGVVKGRCPNSTIYLGLRLERVLPCEVPRLGRTVYAPTPRFEHVKTAYTTRFARCIRLLMLM